MEKIKLIVFPGNFLPHTGGLESHVDNFVKYLSKNYDNYEITIFTPNTENALSSEYIHNDVLVLRYPAFFIVNNFPFPKFWKLQFYKMLIELYMQDYSVVMTRTMFFVNTTLGTLFAKFRLSSIKLIHVEHGSDYSKLDSKIVSLVNKFYMQTLGKLTLKLSNRIVCVSEAGKTFLREKFNIKKRIDLIYRGVDKEYFASIKKSEYFDKYKWKKNIVFAGRLIDGKGVQDIIEVLSKLDSTFMLHIIGDGEYKSKLEGLANKFNLKNINFIGKLKHRELIAVLKQKPLFINPSYTEGLPTSVLDALFSYCPIIATNVGGTEEILKSKWNINSYYQLYTAKNTQELQDKILNYFKINVVGPDVEEEMKQFDWNEHARQYNTIIHEMLQLTT